MNASSSENTLHFGFLMEQTLGHVTHGQNLARRVAEEPGVRSAWMPVEPHQSDIWERLPGVRGNWSLKGSLRARDALRKTTRVQPLDALFIHTQTISLFSRPFMRRIATLISLDATPLNFDSLGAAYGHQTRNSWLEQRKFAWHRRVFMEAAELIAWSEWVKTSLVQQYHIPSKRIRVVPPGVDLKFWDGRRDRTTVKGSVRLLFVGGDFERKGGPLLLKAFRNGLSQRCTLDIVTKDRKVEEELHGEARIHVHYGLTANSDKLRRLYAQSDLFVLPTKGDCLPLAILEALAAGLPVVATDVGAINEAVIEGENGFLVPSGDDGALWKALNALTGDAARRQAFGQAARQRAEERFDAECNYGTILARLKALASCP